MRYRSSITSLVFLVVLAVSSAAAQTSVSPQFLPRYTFEGSDLRGWAPVGSAAWNADDGIITADAGSGPGMLLFDRAYEDVGVFTRFRCQGACDAGVLLRLEETGDGMEGILIHLADGTSMPYRVTIRDGRIVQRTSIAGEMEEENDEAPTIQRGEWNDVTVIATENTIHHDLNQTWELLPRGQAQDVEPTFGPSGVAHYDPDVTFAFGPVGLYVGSGRVEFEDVSTRDMLRQDIEPERSSEHFRVQQLNEFYHAWGADAGDVNNDGILDLVSGPFYYLGPDYTARHEIYRSRTYHAGEEYVPDMVTFSGDYTGDGWDDVLATESRRLALYVNPHGERRHWTRYDALPEICSEIVIQHDLDRDGEMEYVYASQDGRLAYGEPAPGRPTGPFQTHYISADMGIGCMAHGLGVGDVNGDGRADVLNEFGWWEQPASGAASGAWTLHAGPGFGNGGAISVADFNGDGANDVVGSGWAHGWGLSWFEQADGGFVKHRIFDNYATPNVGGVVFSQPHSGALVADMDGDGTEDFVTGKRHWAHLNQVADPDHDGEAVVYWYRTVRDTDAPGGVRFDPELIHNKSGVGSEFKLVDMNRDGAMDIIASGTRGTFIFWNLMKGPATSSR